MQYGPLGGAVRVVIASDAPQAVAELDKLASYADQVSLVGFIRHPQELEEDLEALLPDLVLLYTGFGGLDTVELAGYLASRSAQLRVMVVVDPTDALFIARLEDAGAATVGADADPATLVAALRGAVAQPPSPEEGEPPSWPGLTPRVLWPGEPEAEYGTPRSRAFRTRAFSARAVPGPRAVLGPEPPRPRDSPPPSRWPPAASPPRASARPTGRPGGPQPLGGAGPRGTDASPPRFPSSSSTPRPSRPPPRPRPRRPGRGSPPSPPRPRRRPRRPFPTEPDSEPIAPVRPRLPRRRPGGNAELVVVFSGKGGVGKSLIATNLAVALAADGERVALVDLDLQFGDVAVMLHVESHATAIDALAQQGDQIDADFIEEVMATGPEGVRALLAPSEPGVRRPRQHGQPEGHPARAGQGL